MLITNLLLMSICIVLVISQIFSIILLRRHSAKIVKLEGGLHHLQEDFSALTGATRGAGDHLVNLEQKVRRLTERHDQLELRIGSQRSYNEAIELVQQGGSVEKLMSNCGLTRGEADLIVMLHGGLAKAGLKS